MSDPVMLVGEAAKSYVELQWYKFYVMCGLAGLIVLFMIAFIVVVALATRR